MFRKILKALRRPPYTIRVSPHTRKLEIVPVLYIDIYDETKHQGDDTCEDDYDINQLGYWEDEDDE